MGVGDFPVITRLRPAHTPAVLAGMYAMPHSHGHLTDHVMRASDTVKAAKALGRVASAADLSCGDGYILMCLAAETKIYGDFAPGYQVTGPLEETLPALAPVDLYVCCETLEHVDDPAAVLRLIRSKTRTLLLSTPVDAWGDANPEHYWAWNQQDVDVLLAEAGFQVTSYTTSDMRGAGYQYCFGIWTAQ